MKKEFEEYEKKLIAHLKRSVEAVTLQQYAEPDKPEGYDDFKIQQAKEIQVYELELQMYNSALSEGGEAHARHAMGKKTDEPEDYATYCTLQEAYKIAKFNYYDYQLKCFNEATDTYERPVIAEPIKPEGYDKYKATQEKSLLKKQNKQNKQQSLEQGEVKGYVFDADNIPQYLTADDVYNGIENPVWTKKHTKFEEKIATHKTTEGEKLGINYDEDGIPEYLNAEARHFGEANPEWLKKHEPHNYQP